MSISGRAFPPDDDAVADSASARAPVGRTDGTPGASTAWSSKPSLAAMHRPCPSRSSGRYHRYHIDVETAPELVPIPPRFRVRVKKHRLIGMVVRELIETRGNLPVALSRPCVYGVFSRPVGGLAPREELCVGCLRCTMQYPEMVQVLPNVERQRLGDSFATADSVDTILYEARTGRVPVRGAGYRGPFGGTGWDGLWTDMSEIVRPTRDGIHGREFISTAIELGERPAYLRFDAQGEPVDPLPPMVTTQVPFLFDASAMPAAVLEAGPLVEILAEAAREVESLVMVPFRVAVERSLAGPHVVPVVAPSTWSELDQLSWSPHMVELEGWDPERFDALRRRLPGSVVCVRVPMDADVVKLVHQGARVLHLVANYHGESGDRFAMDLIRQAHQRLVEAGLREEVTLIGSGGMVMAEHVPKAIICGLDAVGLELALAVALQARFTGECVDRATAVLEFSRMEQSWGVRRVKNLAAAWRDQLLEILGAMGLREVRRLRGELGRCMFQSDLEQEVFGELR
jgi:hypothetical protein